MVADLHIKKLRDPKLLRYRERKRQVLGSLVLPKRLKLAKDEKITSRERCRRPYLGKRVKWDFVRMKPMDDGAESQAISPAGVEVLDQHVCQGAVRTPASRSF